VTVPSSGPSSGTSPGLPVAKLLAPPTPAAGTVAKTPGEQMGKDTFLKLLVAQLKYQNPLEPTDSAQFMAQTAQFTVVEKLDALTKTNAELLSTNRALGASSLLGQSVVSAGPDGADVVAKVTGVRFDAAGPVLLTGDTEVSLAAVKEVRPAGA
jgi:flagellar basal-body rod modification protein FlgD